MKKSLLILTCLVLLGGIGNLSFARPDQNRNISVNGLWEASLSEYPSDQVKLFVYGLNDSFVDGTLVISGVRQIRGLVSEDGRQLTLVGMDSVDDRGADLRLSDDGLTLTGVLIKGFSMGGPHRTPITLRKVQ